MKATSRKVTFPRQRPAHMKNTASPERVMARLLRKVVAEAGALGELKFRRMLNEGEMKHQRSVREHGKWLDRTRFLLQQQWEQLTRLAEEMQLQLDETVDLLTKTAYNVARPLPRPNPYRHR